MGAELPAGDIGGEAPHEPGDIGGFVSTILMNIFLHTFQMILDKNIFFVEKRMSEIFFGLHIVN